MSAKTYEITVRAKFHVAGMDDESTFQVIAKDHAEALKRARKHMRWTAGHTRHDGPLSYRAKVAS